MIKKNKGKKTIEKLTKEIVRKENNLFFMVLAVIFLLFLVFTAFLILVLNIRNGKSFASYHYSKENIISARESCFASPGRSWCEAQRKCIFLEKETCREDSGYQMVLEKYLSKNLIHLSPVAGKSASYTVSEVNLLSDNSAFVGYFDDQDFYNAEVVFTVLPNETIKIESFSIKNKNGLPYDLMACEKDSDCLPLPTDCHPHYCINKELASDFSKPAFCNEIFDFSAAYKAEDCLCDFSRKQCFNKNSIKAE